MAIFHLSQQIIGKGGGKSAIAASAYRACTKLIEHVVDSATGLVKKITHDYRNKKGLEYSTILAPNSVSKDSWVFNRQKLWSAVQDREIRLDAQFCREFNVALPIELSKEENKELILSFVSDVFVSSGMVADISIHYDNPDNPHAHVMLTTRELLVDGNDVKFGLKNRAWNDKKFLFNARESWASYVNQELRIRGFEERITHKSFKELGLNIEPTVHEGPSRHIANAKLGILNQDIIKRNARMIVETPDIVIDTINKTTFSRADIEAKILEYLRIDTCSDDQIMASKFLYCIEKVLSSDKLVKVQDFRNTDVFTSKLRIDNERAFIDAVKLLNSSNNHVIQVTDIASLSDQQKAAVYGVCAGQDISIIEGLPGSGKTTSVKEIVRQYRNNGYKVFGTSTSSIATRNLSQVADIEAKTIAKWKWNNNLFKAGMDNKTLFIVDEMSMVDFESFYFLIDACKRFGCKVVLLGDTNQFSAIGTKGAATKMVQICGSIKLDDVQRHENQKHRMATKHLGNYEISKAFDIYNETNVLKVFETNAKEQLVLDYVSDYVTHSDKRHIVLGYKNDTVNELNLMIRNKLVKHGVLELGVNVGGIFLSKGDRVIFCRNEQSIDVLNGEEGIVLDGDIKGNVRVMIGNRTTNFNVKDYDDFKYGYAITCYKSQGATYDTVKVMYEPIMNYETFNVMMSRHKEEVGFYINRVDLLDKIYTKTRIEYRMSDIDLIKGKLESKFSLKTSNLLRLDFLDDKCQKIKEYIDAKNMIRMYSKMDIDINSEVAKKYLQMIDDRNRIASEINNNIHDYKDYLGYARISMNEIQKSSKFENKDIFKVRETALEIESKLILKQQEYDHVVALKKHQDIVTKVCQNDFLDAFSVFKDRRAAEDKFRLIYFESENKLEALESVKEDPKLLGELKGFSIFGFQSGARKISEKKICEYIDSWVIKERNSVELNTYKPLDAIKEEINQLQASLDNVLKHQHEHQQEQNQNNQHQQHQEISQHQRFRTVKTFIKYDDIKLSKSDYEDIFNKYISYINANEKPKKFGDEIKCGSLSMDLKNGLWMRFATNDKGNIYQFVEYALGCDKREALETVARHMGMQVTENVVWNVQEHISNKKEREVTKKDFTNTNKWEKLNTIPNGIYLNPSKDLSWMSQNIEAVYEYRNINNNLIGYTIRCYENDKKNILPIVLCTNGEKTQWMSRGFGNHLYGIEGLREDNKDVLIVEGEKTRDAAQKLLPEYTVIAFAGANRLENLDFSILKDRNVVIFPDNDAAGINAASKVSEELEKHNINHKIVDTKQFPDKWDLADELTVPLSEIRDMIKINSKSVNLRVPQQHKEVYETALYDNSIYNSMMISRIADHIKHTGREKITDIYNEASKRFETRDKYEEQARGYMYSQIKKEHGHSVANSFAEQFVEHKLIYGDKLTTDDLIRFKEVAIKESQFDDIIVKQMKLCVEKDRAYDTVIRCMKFEVRKQITNHNFWNKGSEKQVEFIRNLAKQMNKEVYKQHQIQLTHNHTLSK